MRDYDDVRRDFERHQESILGAIEEARNDLYDLPDDVESELSSALTSAEAYAEDLVYIVESREDEFVVGGVVTVYNVPAKLTVRWDRDAMAAVGVEIESMENGWSPSEVEGEDGESLPPRDDQCYQWQSFMRDLPGTEVSA